jgi:NACHT domain
MGQKLLPSAVKEELQDHAKLLTLKMKQQRLLAFSEEELFEHSKELLERNNVGFEVQGHLNSQKMTDYLIIKRSDPLGAQYVGVIVVKGLNEGEIALASDEKVVEIIDRVRKLFGTHVEIGKLEVGQITDVWVIFAGELSEGARNKIDYELQRKQPLRLFSLNWMIEQFTNYYPEIFFHGKVANILETKIQLIDTKRTFANKAIPLSEVWVSPWVREYKSSRNLEETLKNTLALHKLPFSKLEELVRPNRYIILVGDPGTGKSTALAKIALDLLSGSLSDVLESEADKKVKFPIFIRAKDFSNYSTIDSLKDSVIPENISKEEIQIQALLIDGLDEISSEKWPTLLKTAREYCDFLKCGLVVTSRKVDYLTNPLFPAFERYEILPMEQQQAVDLLHKFVDDQKVMSVLLEGIEREDLKMSLTPLALELLIKIATLEREIPASTAEIFDQYTDISLGRLDSSLGIDVVFEYHAKKSFLAELAWSEFYKKNKFEITKNEFNVFLGKFIFQHGFDEQKMSKFTDEIERAGIVRFGDSIYFRHRSFLEYFTSLRIVQHVEEFSRLDQELTSVYYSEFWSEVVFFYIGIRRRITRKLLDNILDYPKDDLKSSILKLFVGRLLQAGWYTESDVKKYAIRESSKTAIQVRDKLLGIMNETENLIPPFYADVLTYTLMEYSYCSKTLEKDLLAEVSRALEVEEGPKFVIGLMLLYSGRKYLNYQQRQEFQNYATKQLSQLEISKCLSVDDKYSSLFLLEHIGKDGDTPVMRDIKRKLKEFSLNYPEEIKRLLGVEYAPRNLPQRRKRNKPKAT